MRRIPHPTSLKRGDRVGAYTVVRPLGSGSYGAVFLAEQAGRRFALKFAMHRASSGDPAHTAARARNELMCLLRVGYHPHVITVHGFDHWPEPTSGWLYVVLDYVEGDTLARWARRAHPTAREVVRLFVKLFAALAHLHALGLLHRDLKVTNIMVRRNGEPVLLDFSTGEAPFTEALTDGPLPPGTPRYRTPEAVRFHQRHKQDVAARYTFQPTDDIYALGLCLYDVLTSLRAEHLTQPPLAHLMPPPAREVNGRVPAALSDVVRALIARAPEHRPPTAEAARRLLEGLEEEESEEWKVPVHRPEDALEAERELSSVVRLPLPTPTEPTPAEPRRSRRWGWAAGSLLGAAVAGAVGVALSGRNGATASSPSPERPQGSATPGPSGQDGSAGGPPARAGPKPAAPSAPPSEKPLSSVSPEVGAPGASAPEVRKKPAPPSPRPQRPPAPTDMKTPLELSAEFLKQCANATAAAALAAGCATTGVRPAPADCPKEALQVMFGALEDGGLGWDWGTPNVNISIDKNRRARGSEEDFAVFTDGAIEAYVERGHAGMPTGTFLKGQLWTGTGALVGRYHEALLPDGRTLPVCIIASETFKPDGSLIPGMPGSKPGAVIFSRWIYAVPVKRWP